MFITWLVVNFLARNCLQEKSCDQANDVIKQLYLNLLNPSANLNFKTWQELKKWRANFSIGNLVKISGIGILRFVYAETYTLDFKLKRVKIFVIFSYKFFRKFPAILYFLKDFAQPKGMCPPSTTLATNFKWNFIN